MNITNCFNCNNFDLHIDNELILCKHCGFYTTSKNINLTSGWMLNPITPFDKFMYKMPKLIKLLKKKDKVTKLYWLPIILNNYPNYVISPDGTETKWRWIQFNYNKISNSNIYELNISIPIYYNTFYDVYSKLFI